MFGETLNKYMELVNCSGKELSEYTGISESTVSRYRSGERVPSKGTELEKLCRGICRAAEEKNTTLEFDEVYRKLAALIKQESFDFTSFCEKINLLFSALPVNAAEISKAMRYDSSYISRIRNGERKPSKPTAFASELSSAVAKKYCSDSDKRITAELMGISVSEIQKKSDYEKHICEWLCRASGNGADNPINKFLSKLDVFDLNQYIKSIRFDEMKVPTIPFSLPSSKHYYGLEEIKDGELDFLRATALSKSKQSVFMCSDMQMDDMACDMEFSKKYMFGLAAMLKKGLHLNVIHNLNRPFNEIMLGLENWIPLYMTGQISPFYINGVHNRIFCHLLNVSGAAALSGECISGHHAKSRYYLTNSKSELEYYGERAEFLLKKALPLMEIYRENNSASLRAFLASDCETGGNITNYLISPPLYALDGDMTEKILTKSAVSAQEREKITNYICLAKERFGKSLENGTVTDVFGILSCGEFKKHPVSLSLSEIFPENDIHFEYDEYLTLCSRAKELSLTQNGYSVRISESNPFRNINISVKKGNYVMISKNNSPAIHFVIRHPTLIGAFENFEFPII